MKKYKKFNILSSKTRKKRPSIQDAVSEFLVSKKAMNCTKKTIQSYKDTLKPFTDFCSSQNVILLESVDNFFLDSYFSFLTDNGHSDGGKHAYYRSLRAFMRWSWDVYKFGSECPTDHSKVKAPPNKPIPGIPEDVVRLILEEAKRTEYPQRDTAFVMFLCDTGARKQEAANIRIKDVDLETGNVKIEFGKGNKTRDVHVGNKARKAIREYLKTVVNDKPDDKLWESKDGYAMSANGLVEILRRIQKNLGIEKMYSMHDFRRYCALSMYRQSHDLLAVSLYLGHSSVEITKRYLNIVEKDIQEFGETFSNVDKLSRIRPNKKIRTRPASSEI